MSVSLCFSPFPWVSPLIYFLFPTCYSLFHSLSVSCLYLISLYLFKSLMPFCLSAYSSKTVSSRALSLSLSLCIYIYRERESTLKCLHSLNDYICWYNCCFGTAVIYKISCDLHLKNISAFWSVNTVFYFLSMCYRLRTLIRVLESLVE